MTVLAVRSTDADDVPRSGATRDPGRLLPDFRIGVARTGHLIAVKMLSRDDVTRPQDLVDLRALLRVAPRAELERARQALMLIGARGYHRGRDLMADMSRLVAV